MTMGASSVGDTLGLGVGYAYRMEDERNTAFTVAVGRAGGETAIQGSVGFEFGGSKPKPPPPPPLVQEIQTREVVREVRIDEARTEELEQQLRQMMTYANQLEERLADLEKTKRVVERTIVQTPYLSAEQKSALMQIKEAK